MKVGVIGTGYVGLVTGVSFAEHGNDVTCVDIDAKKVAMMQDGVSPIHEKGLEEIMRRNIQEGRLHFTTDLADGILGKAAVFLALPTPEDEDGSADLQYILQAAEDIGSILKDYTVIVNKSTVPAGTAELVRERIASKAKVDFDVVSNPEFLREGQAVEDVRVPDRIVVGTSSDRARDVMSELYEPYVRNGNPIRYMSAVSAELTKYVANGFLATKLSFINEAALLADALGADINDILLATGDDPRIGKKFLKPGPGWGGSCFPKDSRALIHMARERGLEFRIMEAADKANDSQLIEIPRRVKEYFEQDLRGKKLALWGLAFKRDTDDIRESPAVNIMLQLLEAGAHVCAYDPAAMPNTKARFGKEKGLTFAETQYAALEGADALVIATEWEAFGSPDLPKVKQLLKSPVVFDGRLLLKPALMMRSGFYYDTIGRPKVKPSA